MYINRLWVITDILNHDLEFIHFIISDLSLKLHVWTYSVLVS